MNIRNEGKQSAAANMERDRALVQEGPLKPLLLFYDWISPCATYGHFINPQQFFTSHTPFETARRPTGGGIIFHSWDVTFTIWIPSTHPLFSLNTLENYTTINTRVARAIAFFTGKTPSFQPCSSRKQKPTFCLTQPTVYDILIDGKKIGGAAQRQTKKGFLHQGAIPLSLPPYESLKEVLLEPQKIYKEMEKTTYCLLIQPSNEELEGAKKDLTGHLSNIFNTL